MKKKVDNMLLVDSDYVQHLHSHSPYFKCKVCSELIPEWAFYCPMCGSKIKWSLTDDFIEKNYKRSILNGKDKD